jgi:UDP-N-acetylglucosamine 2-epimerase (non-hydrolysing)
MLRSSHERPEGMDSGVSIMSGLSEMDVLQAIEISVGTNSNYQGSVSDYDEGPVSYKILKIVISYIDYINKKKWMKFSPPNLF